MAQHGLALHELGRTDQAITRFLETSEATLPIVTIEHAKFVRVDDMRGRSEAVTIVESLCRDDPSNALYPSLLASIRLNQDRFDDANAAVERALQMQDVPAVAHAVAGRLMLIDVDETANGDIVSQALSHFRAAKKLDRGQPWVDEGIRRCLEQLGRYAGALTAYETAAQIAVNDFGERRPTIRRDAGGGTSVGVDAARRPGRRCHRSGARTRTGLRLERRHWAPGVAPRSVTKACTGGHVSAEAETVLATADETPVEN